MSQNRYGTILSAFIVASLLSVTLVACGPKKVHYLDNDDVEIVYLQEEREDDILVLHIGFRAEGSSNIYHTVYKIEWFKDDVFVESSSWRPLIVKGDVIVRVTERSTVPGVDKFQIVITNDPS